ncbi:MAG: hypothetical protein IJZ19_08255 [Lentisphaeria bacterium]|nr:hypothetical protein [Lentisphaeria bacterium]
MKSILTAAQRHHLALHNAGLVIPEVAETLLEKYLKSSKLPLPSHAFSLISTHIEPDQGCCFFDFAAYCREANRTAVRKGFQALKKNLQKNSAAVKGKYGSECCISDLFLLAEDFTPPPLNGVIFFGRFKTDLTRSAFHFKDAPLRVSEVRDYAEAEETLQKQIPCRLTRIDIDFAQEPELLFLLDAPLNDGFQLPGNMAEVERNSKVLLVRLPPLETE